MQALQDNFFYHSYPVELFMYRKPRLGSDGDLQHEKQLLIEEQKLCTARARRFTQQTNRRRKVLEEKRKQWDLQEQQYREKVLQLRRQQVQDATERFQRAHLPSSQRQRQSFRKHALNIEDALKQIKGTVSSYTQPTLSSHSNITRSCTPSPKPPTVPKSSQALSVVDAYTQLLQEQSSWVKSSQEIPMAQERQQDHSTQPGKDSHYMPPQKELRSSINNVYEVSNLDPKTKKPINTVSPQQAGVSYFLSETPKSPKCPEKDEQKLPVSEGASHAVHEVRFVKGILKKESKHMKGDITHVYGSGQFIFAKQVALAIRDSVELTKMKTKEVEGKNTVKKLRWLDEVQMEKVDKQQNMMKGRLSNLSQSKNNSEDHQLSLTAVSGASKPGPSLTPSASPGYHFTKQAWADVGVQVSLPQERVDEVKVPRCSTRTGGPKALQRELTARVGAGPVSSWIRKGIVMQPQAATGVSQIAKTHGRMLVPRPPPRRESTQEKSQYPIKTPYGKDHTNVNCKQPLPTEEALHKDNLQGFILPYTHIIRTDSSVIYTPLPPSYTCPVPESNMKYLPSLGHQDNQSHGRRRRMVCSEKGLCLDCTPTDDEISQLWHSVRSALSTKDEKNIQEREATGGGQAVRKPCMEQSRQPPDTRNKRLPQSSQATQQPADQERLYSIPGEVHLAEVHAEGLPEGRDVTAAMATVKTQMPGTVQQRQQQGLTSISLEEQKILLSLDRLNHHLHSVREHFGGPTGTGIVLTDTLSTREMKTTNHHRHNLSNNRTQYQKKC
ncbi:centrosomal protein of 126 kDa [Aulostomus maculatus]